MSDGNNGRRLQTLREIEVKSGKFIRLPTVISDCMRKYSESASVTGCMFLCIRTGQNWPPHRQLELMEIKETARDNKKRTLDRSVSNLREALSVWLAEGNEITYSA